MSNVKGYSNELYNHDDLKIVYDKKNRKKILSYNDQEQKVLLFLIMTSQK